MHSAWRAIFLALVAVCLVAEAALSQTTTTLVIDDFSSDQEPLFFPTGFTTSVYEHDSSRGAMIGGERDLAMDIFFAGEPDKSFIASVDHGLLNIDGTGAEDAGVVGTVTIQWDGVDGGPALQTNGLAALDMGSVGSVIVFTGTSPPTVCSAELRLYSGGATGDHCGVQFFINTLGGSDDGALASVPLDHLKSFGAGCSLSSVGAIEVELDLYYGESIHIAEISLQGPSMPTSPSPSPPPSQSPVPSSTPSPSPSRPPSPSPSPIPAYEIIPVGGSLSFTVTQDEPFYFQTVDVQQRGFESLSFTLTTNTTSACLATQGGSPPTQASYDQYACSDDGTLSLIYEDVSNPLYFGLASTTSERPVKGLLQLFG